MKGIKLQKINKKILLLSIPILLIGGLVINKFIHNESPVSNFLPTSVSIPKSPIKNQVTINFAPNTTEDQKHAYIKSIGGVIDKEITSINAIVVSVNYNDINKPLPDSSLVSKSEPDYLVAALGSSESSSSSDKTVSKPNDPMYSKQWALDVISASSSWAKLTSEQKNKEVTVAVIDSGVCIDHQDLSGRILSGWNFISNNTNVKDDYGHGCEVSGIIASDINNKIGIVGVAPTAKILPLKVLDNKGLGSYSNVAAAVVYATDKGAKIINLSLGGYNSSTVLQNAINYAEKNNVIIVAASGNDGKSQVLYPAKYSGVIAVGSIDQDLKKSSFSNYGSGISIWAPGSNILTTTIDGGYGYVSGTSFATPQITGLKTLDLIAGTKLIIDGKIANVNTNTALTTDKQITPDSNIVTAKANTPPPQYQLLNTVSNPGDVLHGGGYPYYTYPILRPNGCDFELDAGCVDPWGFGKRECVSYVAWRINIDRGVDVSTDSSYPYLFTNTMYGTKFGSAINWYEANKTAGIFEDDNTPTPGDILIWNSGKGYHAGGHVAIFGGYDANGLMIVQDFNHDGTHSFRNGPIVRAVKEDDPNHIVKIKPRQDNNRIILYENKNLEARGKFYVLQNPSISQPTIHDIPDWMLGKANSIWVGNSLCAYFFNLNSDSLGGAVTKDSSGNVTTDEALWAHEQWLWGPHGSMIKDLSILKWSNNPGGSPPNASNSIESIVTGEPCVLNANGVSAKSTCIYGPNNIITPPTNSENSAFVSDLTIPDGTILPPSNSFVKTWRIKNNGNTTWNTGYRLSFYTSDQMSGPTSVALTSLVSPNQTVDISVNLTSPQVDGSYNGYWKMQNSSGQFFGQVVFVIIQVTAGAPSPGSTTTINLYNQSNYSGTAYSYAVGTSNVASVNTYSLKIPSGWSVVTYSGQNESGQNRCWYQSNPNLQNDGWQNMIQSVQVYNYVYCGGGGSVNLYSLSNYQNLIGQFSPGVINDLNADSYSMTIPSGWSVTTYDQNHENGGSTCWNSSQANLQDTNNWQLRIRSMEIRPTDNCSSNVNQAVICSVTGWYNDHINQCKYITDNISDLGASGFPGGNGNVRALNIQGDYVVTMFSGTNFTGNHYVTDTSNSDLGGINIGYNTSSIQVRRKNPNALTLFRGGNYNDGGPFVTDRTLNNLSFWDRNNISESLQVASGYEVIGCTQSDFHGNCGRTTTNVADLNSLASGLKDNLASVAVCQGHCGPTPTAPTLLDPISNARFIPGTPINFDWSGNAEQYFVEIWGGTLTSTIQVPWSTNRSYATNLLGTALPYYWHVKSWNHYGEGSTSPDQSFIVQDIAPTKLLISGPTTVLLNTDNSYTAYINPSDASNLTYQWSPIPKTGQGTATATYNFNNSGNNQISLTLKNTGGTISNQISVVLTCPSGQYLGDYYPNKNLTGTPNFSKCENAINNNWKNSGPDYLTSIDLGDGRDGDLTVPTGVTNYTDNFRSNIVTTFSASTKTITVSNGSGMSVGDKILIIQMQGINAGTYEVQIIGSIVYNVITLVNPLNNTYTMGNGSSAQIMKIFQYKNIDIEGTLTAHPWDGSTGGVLAFKASGNLVINGAINTSGIGYRFGSSDCCSSGSQAGEGINTNVVFQNTPNANGGGGGNQSLQGGPGGGGGGNFTPGIIGNNGGAGASPGWGGVALDNSNFTKLYLGGGGGAGGRAYSQPGGIGGNGGGIAFISAGLITINGSLLGNGTNGGSGATGNPGPENQWGSSGGGGGGAGGSILLQGQNIDIGNLKLNAVGGYGGISTSGSSGYGGLGGNGAIKIQYCNNISGTSNTNSIIEQKQCGVGVNNYSVRWTGNIGYIPSNYTFTSVSSDGIRAWIDNNIIINKWIDGLSTNTSNPINLTGSHIVKVEYYVGTGNGQISFTSNQVQNHPPVVTQIPGQTITKGQLFANINLSNYGSDPDVGDSITWSYSGNTNIKINIVNNIATLTYPSTWTGSENIIFKATDTHSVTASSTATFIVNLSLPVGTELLSQPWHLSSNNGASELYQAISSNVFSGKDTIRIKYDLHGLTALTGDASAIIFDQNGWQYISLSKYGVNGKNGIQTVDIPLSDFTGLNLTQGSTTVHTRFWYSSPFVVDIYSIMVYKK